MSLARKREISRLNLFRGRDEVVMCCSNSDFGVRPRDTSTRPMMFDRFRMPYGKVYNGVDEVSVRFDNFKANVGVIRTTNVPNVCRSGCAPQMQEEFAAMHLEERNKRACGVGLPSSGTHDSDGAPLASSVDWSTRGVVLP